VIVELAGLGTLTALYLTWVPVRPPALDLGLALLALLVVLITAPDTRRRIWGPPDRPAAERLRHSAIHLLTGTAVAVALFAALGAARVWWATETSGTVAASLLRPTLPAALGLFIPWALLQQTLFQFYLLGRMRALWPAAPAHMLAGMNGIVYGAVHLPAWDITAVTMIGGAVWSWYYLRDRQLLPIAFSHAVLGTTYFYWVRGQDLIREWLAGN
jgi:membrane protease YdiL (CAAX protease family)